MPNTREKLIELLERTIANAGNGREMRFTGGDVVTGLIPTVQKWIPVTERLPENDTYILVATDGVAVSAYWHNDRFYAFTANGVATVGGVTHWMPLPEPPKGE